jgi:hypothetical protein
VAVLLEGDRRHVDAPPALALGILVVHSRVQSAGPEFDREFVDSGEQWFVLVVVGIADVDRLLDAGAGT